MLIVTNMILWTGASAMLSGSVVRLLRSRERHGDDVLAGLSLISALIALFFARRVANGDDSVFTVLCVLSLALVAYVYRLGWGRRNAG